MLSKMSKSDKTMFYYLGLSLLLLIVLGVLFGISSVKESFDKPGLFIQECGTELKKHRGCQVKKYCEDRKLFGSREACKKHWWLPSPANDLKGSSHKKNGGGPCAKTLRNLYKCQINKCREANPKDWCKRDLLNKSGDNPEYLRKGITYRMG